MDFIKVLHSGSKGNSTLISFNNQLYFIDMGVSYKKLIASASQYCSINSASVFITHDHSDHVKGLKSFARNVNCQIYGSNDICSKFQNVLPITQKMTLNNVVVETLYLSHDCINTLGYIFYLNNYKVVIISDTGYLSDVNLQKAKNPDILILEANHDVEMLMDGKYHWRLKNRILSDTGHLSNNQFKNYAKNIIGDNTKYLIATHLSADNNSVTKVAQICNEFAITTFVASQDKGAELIKLNWR